jgi:tetratricopeptide (TPR) repeat protein
MSKATVAMVLVLAAFPLAASGPSHGPEALRNLAVSPKMSFTLGYAYKCRQGLEVIVETKEPWGDIRRLQRALREQPGNVGRMIELAEILDETEATNAARAGWQEVERLCRQRLEVNADDPLLLMQSGEALEALDRSAEAESDYRRAVAAASNDWRCWAGLGHFLQARAGSLLVPKSAAGRIESSPNPALPDWLNCRPTPDALQQFEKIRREAGRCLDRALALAPKEPEAWVQLAAYAGLSNFQSRLIAHFKGEDQPPLDAGALALAFISANSVAHLKRAADLSRTNCALIAAAGGFKVMELRNRRPEVPQDSLRESVREEILLLENLGRQADKNAAAGALAALAFVQMTLGDTSASRASAREAAAEDPTLDSAWDILLGTSFDSDSPEEFVALCESRLKQQDSVRNHLFLAEALLRQQKPDKADAQAHAALKIEPNDLEAYILLAAVELKRSENPQFMEAAERAIRRAMELFQAAPAGADTLDRWREIWLNAAIWEGLQAGAEHQEAAKTGVQAVLRRLPDDQTAKDILHALE